MQQEYYQTMTIHASFVSLTLGEDQVISNSTGKLLSKLLNLSSSADSVLSTTKFTHFSIYHQFITENKTHTLASIDSLTRPLVDLRDLDDCLRFRVQRCQGITVSI